MGADFSRIRSNPLLDFAGVELKQGGVVLDADFNEMAAIVDRRLRAAASDILGRSTVSQTTPDAFAAAGGRRASSAREVAEHAEIVLLLLPSSAALDAVSEGPDGLARAVRAGTTVIE